MRRISDVKLTGWLRFFKVPTGRQAASVYALIHHNLGKLALFKKKIAEKMLNAL